MSVRTTSFVAAAAAAIALLGSASSFAAGVPAGETESFQSQPVPHSNLSRAEVRAAVLAAVKDHSLPGAGEIIGTPVTPQASELRRADVRRATAIAVRTGQVYGAGEALASGPVADTRIQ